MSGNPTAHPQPIATKPKKPTERRYSLAEYLAMEETSEVNHEFDNGKLIPMPGGSPNHSYIKGRVITTLNNQLDRAEKAFPVYNSDIRIHLPELGRGVMPDAAVVVGEPEFSVEKPVGLLLNPTLIVEVLSDSTESYDRGLKFAHYRTLPSFQEYVLVSQDAPRVETFWKETNGKWFLNEVVEGLDSVVPLVTLGVDLPLRDLYFKVVFEAKKSRRRG